MIVTHIRYTLQEHKLLGTIEFCEHKISQHTCYRDKISLVGTDTLSVHNVIGGEIKSITKPPILTMAQHSEQNTYSELYGNEVLVSSNRLQKSILSYLA